MREFPPMGERVRHTSGVPACNIHDTLLPAAFPHLDELQRFSFVLLKSRALERKGTPAYMGHD
eukprot:1156805-Pelagomonas_calceolata.AAC.4